VECEELEEARHDVRDLILEYEMYETTGIDEGESDGAEMADGGAES
jgi:hypothetical protein